MCRAILGGKCALPLYRSLYISYNIDKDNLPEDQVSFVGHHFVAPMTFLFAATVRINEILFNKKKIGGSGLHVATALGRFLCCRMLYTNNVGPALMDLLRAE